HAHLPSGDFTPSVAVAVTARGLAPTGLIQRGKVPTSLKCHGPPGEAWGPQAPILRGQGATGPMVHPWFGARGPQAPGGTENLAAHQASGESLVCSRTTGTFSPMSRLPWLPSGAQPADSRNSRRESSADSAQVYAARKPSSASVSATACSSRPPWPCPAS